MTFHRVAPVEGHLTDLILYVFARGGIEDKIILAERDEKPVVAKKVFVYCFSLSSLEN